MEVGGMGVVSGVLLSCVSGDWLVEGFKEVKEKEEGGLLLGLVNILELES